MRFPRLQQHLITALCSVAFATLAPSLASAQQVTYYNFDTPQTNPSQVSNTCSVNSAPANVLFCFNYAGIQPSFIQDPTPDYSVLMTQPTGNQAEGMWFSVPQDVVDGFNVWFQFRLTPSTQSGITTADGLAFVIQNASGGQTDSVSSCSSAGGLKAVGEGQGGCIGYAGIDNSVALELDTYQNGGWGDPSDNHIALQSCGPNLPNSPAHSGIGECLVTLSNSISTLVSNPNTSAAPPASPTAVTLADGYPHQIVIVYNGPNDPNPNTISVYLDPGYNTGTHTPVAGSVPLFTGPFTITNYLNLSSDSQTASPAYVGFTAATGADFEQQELMAWTFTPHATVSQQQPLNPPGTQTTANFGTHSYSVTYPQDNTGSTGSTIALGVIANTISPANFAALLGLGATQYTGSSCQVYDDTGGNCIIYSIYCYDTTSKDVVACPALTTPPIDCSSQSAMDCINVKSAYNNSIQPITPGYLQGDPLYSPITSISGDGSTATVTCAGECAVAANQSVTILANAGPPSYNGPIAVQSVVDLSHFTFASSIAGSSTGGFLTSNNVQDIFISYMPQNIDGSTGGKTQNFSDFVVTAATVVASQTKLSAATLSPGPGQADLLTATISTPMGPNSLPLLPLVSGGTVSFSSNSSPIAGCQGLTLTGSQAVCSFTAPLQTGPVTIQAQYSGDPYHQGSSTTLPLNVTGALASVSPASINFGTFYPGGIAAKTVTITNTGNAAMTISDPLIALVQGGQYFVAINLCPKSLAAGKSCTMIVSFVAGTGTGPQMATLTIKTSVPGVQPTVTLSATVINPQAKVSTNSLSFGTVTKGTGSLKTVALTNPGTTALSINSIGISGDTTDFTLTTATTPCQSTLSPGSSCNIGVTFKPLSTGSHTATLVITDNAQNSPQSVSLTGTGH